MSVNLNAMSSLRAVYSLGSTIYAHLLLPIDVQRGRDLIFSFSTRSDGTNVRVLSVIYAARAFGSNHRRLITRFLIRLLSLLTVVFTTKDLMIRLNSRRTRNRVMRRRTKGTGSRRPSPIETFVHLRSTVRSHTRRETTRKAKPQSVRLTSMDRRMNRAYVTDIRRRRRQDHGRRTMLGKLNSTDRSKKSSNYSRRHLSLELALQLYTVMRNRDHAKRAGRDGGGLTIRSGTNGIRIGRNVQEDRRNIMGIRYTFVRHTVGSRKATGIYRRRQDMGGIVRTGERRHALYRAVSRATYRTDIVGSLTRRTRANLGRKPRRERCRARHETNRRQSRQRRFYT